MSEASKLGRGLHRRLSSSTAAGRLLAARHGVPEHSITRQYHQPHGPSTPRILATLVCITTTTQPRDSITSLTEPRDNITGLTELVHHAYSRHLYVSQLQH